MKHFVLTLWLGSTALAVYALHLRYATPVAPPTGAKPLASGVKAPQTRLAGVDLTSGVVLLNFWREGCPCSRFVEPEVREIAKSFPSLRVITVVDGHAPDEAPGTTFEDKKGIAKKFGVWAAPAAVVIDHGRVTYVGAYNVSRYCDNPETAFARKAVQAAIEGRKPAVASTPFFGCALDAGS